MKKKGVIIGLMILFVMPVAAIGILSLSDSFTVKELKVFGEIPDFELQERNGQTVSRESLKGKVWAASFIFTHCAGQCPVMTQKLQRVQNKLRFKENFRLVSISVDPERDTPDILALYANRFSADPFKWLFLTGKKSDIQSLVQHGFRLAAADTESAADGEITHSFKVVLVDGFGRIRGYYDGLEDAEVTSLIKDAKQLIRKTF